MQEKFFFGYYYKYSLLCAVAYCIPVFFFFENEKFTDLWILYIGNICFGILLLISGIFVNHKLDDYASLRSMLMAGMKVIFSSIGIICVLEAILALLFSHPVLKQSPANYTGLYFLLPLNAIVVNFLLGGLAVVLGAVTVKTNQKNEKGEEIT